jgi:hypothetical protein
MNGKPREGEEPAVSLRLLRDLAGPFEYALPFCIRANLSLGGRNARGDAAGYAGCAGN